MTGAVSDLFSSASCPAKSDGIGGLAIVPRMRSSAARGEEGCRSCAKPAPAPSVHSGADGSGRRGTSVLAPSSSGRVGCRPSRPRRPAAGNGTYRLALSRSAVTALLTLVLAAPVNANGSDLCLLAAQDASRLSGVPLSVLLAVTLTETGRTEGGATRPWPWTVNMEGKGHWFATQEEALAFAEGRRAQGSESFDVGCFQINWRWHGENFVSVEQMFDPLANASYAAGFLKTLHQETGDWSAAAGAYHSRTPEYATRYRGRFDAFRAAATAAGADDGRLTGTLALSDTRLAEGAAPGSLPPRLNTFPLLQATGDTPRLGSLVPLGDG